MFLLCLVCRRDPRQIALKRINNPADGTSPFVCVDHIELIGVGFVMPHTENHHMIAAVRKEKSKALAVVPAREVEPADGYPIGKGDLHFTHHDALKHKIMAAAKAVHDARIKIKAKAASRNGRYEQAFTVERQREFYLKIKRMSGHIRHHGLVYGFFYDLPYKKMEETCYTNPDWDEFEKVARSYWNGPDQNFEQKLQEWFDGAKSKVLITQNKYEDKPRAGQALSVSFRPARVKKGPRLSPEQKGELNKAFHGFVRAIRKIDAARHDQAS